ncbi:aspartic protease [Aphelenchoides avenae]|nr:aspartic protease [Aphelenchus avenae]
MQSYACAAAIFLILFHVQSANAKYFYKLLSHRLAKVNHFVNTPQICVDRHHCGVNGIRKVSVEYYCQCNVGVSGKRCQNTFDVSFRLLSMSKGSSIPWKEGERNDGISIEVNGQVQDGTIWLPSGENYCFRLRTECLAGRPIYSHHVHCHHSRAPLLDIIPAGRVDDPQIVSGHSSGDNATRRAILATTKEPNEMSSIHKRETLAGKLKRLGKWKQYSEFTESLGIRRSGSNGTYVHHVNDFRDYMYAANITIGTPPQEFSVDLDTGSPDSWLPDPSCTTSCSCHDREPARKSPCALAPRELREHICPTTSGRGSRKEDYSACSGRKFDSSASSTYKDGHGKWAIHYGTGCSKGFDGVDVIRLGDGQGLVVKDYHFGQATCLGEQPVMFVSDGLFGLSPGKAYEGSDKSIIEAAAAQGLLDKPVFTVWLEEKGAEKNVRAGVFTYGGLDTENCGPVIDYRDTDYLWWKFDIEGVSVGNFSTSGKLQAVSDTGTTDLVGPPDQVEAILTELGVDPYTRVIDCDATFEPLVFTIGGKQYAVDHNQLIIHRWDDPSVCIVPIGAYPFSDYDWLLGDPWVRQYCQVHDFGKKNIGFAKANP